MEEACSTKFIEDLPARWIIEDWLDGDLTFYKVDDEWHAGYDGGDSWYEGPGADGKTLCEAAVNLRGEIEKLSTKPKKE